MYWLLHAVDYSFDISLMSSLIRRGLCKPWTSAKTTEWLGYEEASSASLNSNIKVAVKVVPEE